MQDDAIDYVNIRRLEERCVRLFGEIAETSMTVSLKRKRILGEDGSFDQKYVQENLSGGSYLFDYMNSYETEHYKQLLENTARVTDFADLATAARKGYPALKELQGRYAYFVGGVYGKSPRIPITNSTSEVRVYYPTKKVYIEWILDPKFLMSMFAIIRMGGKNLYIIYRLARTVDLNEEEGRTYVNASPLLYCVTHSIHRQDAGDRVQTAIRAAHGRGGIRGLNLKLEPQAPNLIVSCHLIGQRAQCPVRGRSVLNRSRIATSHPKRAEHRRWDAAVGGGFVGGGDLRIDVFAAGFGAEDQGEGQARGRRAGSGRRRRRRRSAGGRR